MDNNQYQDQSQNNLENSDDTDNENENPDSTRQVGKRRSKNDNQGRDFKCKYCEKTYLSYPALYTHMKQKHSKGPDGELRNPPTSGRGRGRPRKNPYQRLDPRTEDFFKAPERDGGPVDPLCCFEEVYITIFGHTLNDGIDIDKANQTDEQQSKHQEELKKLRLSMYDYPIYMNLIQFSNMVDANGQLLKQNGSTQRAAGQQSQPNFSNNVQLMNSHLQQQQVQMMYGGQNQQPAGMNKQLEGQYLAPPPQMGMGQQLNKVIPSLPGVNIVNNMAGDMKNLNDINNLNKDKGTDEKGDAKQDPSEFEGGKEEDIEKNADADTENQSKPPTAQTLQSSNQKPQNSNGNGFPQPKIQMGQNYGGQYQPSNIPGMIPNLSDLPPMNGQGELPPTANKSKWQRNYDLLTDKDRQEMLVDEIFALYLYRMSNRINQSYYKIVLAYVIFFRECLNEYGWGKKIESEGIKLENNPELKSDIANKQFCLVNNAEHAPEICNEFVTVYMEYKKSIIDIAKHDQIDLTINLCHWLFQCQFTCSKLTMIG